jgi:hypothetical protein
MTKLGKRLLAGIKQLDEGTYVEWTPPELGGKDKKPKYFVRGKRVVSKKIFDAYVDEQEQTT